MQFVHRLSIPGRSLALAGLMLLTVAAVPLASSAHFWGGSWAYNGGVLLPLSYQNNAGAYPSYSNAINTAANNWYATPTASDLYSVAGSANVTLNTFSDATQGYWGVTAIYAWYTPCQFWFCFPILLQTTAGAYPNVTSLGQGWSNYTFSTISFNRATMDGLSDFMKLKVATHELGHAQGLGHAYNPNCTSIMQQGVLTINTPQAHDHYDFDLLYPGFWKVAYAC
jgi:hypothetical protein